jgi:hypothetical protein
MRGILEDLRYARCCQLKLFGATLGCLKTESSKASGRRYRSPNLEGPRSQELVMR